MAEFTLKIDGMHCGSCVRRVSQALGGTGGMVVNEVRLGAARVTFPEEHTSLNQAAANRTGTAVDHTVVDQAIAALAKAGYAAHLDQ